MNREEAIKVLNSRPYTGEVREALETLIPDFRESEDEKIRKWLIDYFKKVGNSWIHREFTCEQIVAYLEKQKEQDWNKKPCLTCQEYEKGHKQGYTEGCTAGYNKAMKEVEQKEQKPHRVAVDTCEAIDKVREFDEQMEKEQKPAEWSEEDEYKLKQCIRIVIGWEGDYDIVKSPYSNFLKSLRPQPKAELTLLDKNIISAAVAFVELNPYNYWCGIDKRTVIKALRSLRPSWKPSVEQMNTLLSVEGILRSLRYDDKAKILASIYEQLKQFYP